MDNYKQFLKDFDDVLKLLFFTQKQYIKCEKGCSRCCEKGDYPMSQIEFSYLTQGYLSLSIEKRSIVQKNFKKVLEDKKIGLCEHRCPFLINNECCVYEYRPIICRTFGVCYYDDTKNYVRLPDCVNFDLNYSDFYDFKNRTLKIPDVPKINLRIDRVLNSELAQKYSINSGEIRPMSRWISK